MPAPTKTNLTPFIEGKAATASAAPRSRSMYAPCIKAMGKSRGTSYSAKA